MTVPTALFAAPEDWGDSSLTSRIDRAATELLALVAADVAGAVRRGNASRYQTQFGSTNDPGIDLDSDLMRLAAGGQVRTGRGRSRTRRRRSLGAWRGDRPPPALSTHRRRLLPGVLRSPRHRARPRRTLVNAVRGTLDAVARLVTEFAPTRVVACWDDDWRPQWRVDLIPSYKTHRVAEVVEVGPDVEVVPDPLTAQVPLIAEALGLLGIPIVEPPSTRRMTSSARSPRPPTARSTS